MIYLTKKKNTNNYIMKKKIPILDYTKGFEENQKKYNTIIKPCGNECEIIHDFLGDKIHYSLWYFEFKQEAQLKIEALEKRLFEIKDEAIEIHKEINNINDAVSNRLTISLK